MTTCLLGLVSSRLSSELSTVRLRKNHQIEDFSTSVTLLRVQSNSLVALKPRELRDLLLDGARDAIASFGWDRTSVSKICGAVGLTSGAFYPRFTDRVDAATVLWSKRLGPMVTAQVTDLLDQLEKGDQDGFVRAMARFAEGSSDLDVAVELLLAAQYDERLAQVVGRDLEQTLRSRFADENSGIAASRVLCVIVAFGLTMSRHRTWAKDLDLEPELHRYFEGLSQPGPVLSLPALRAEYLLHPATLSQDPLLSAFYQNGYRAVSDVGYAKASLKDICNSAGITTGFLFARHEGKLDFFLEVVRQGWKANFDKGLAFAHDVATNYGEVIAEAVVLREFAQPEYRGQVRVNLEIQRLARFSGEASTLVNSEELRLLEQFGQGQQTPDTSYFATEMAVGNGVFLLTSFMEGIETFDFVAPLSTLLKLRGLRVSEEHR